MHHRLSSRTLWDVLCVRPLNNPPTATHRPIARLFDLRAHSSRSHTTPSRDSSSARCCVTNLVYDDAFRVGGDSTADFSCFFFILLFSCRYYFLCSPAAMPAAKLQLILRSTVPHAQATNKRRAREKREYIFHYYIWLGLLCAPNFCLFYPSWVKRILRSLASAIGRVRAWCVCACVMWMLEMRFFTSHHSHITFRRECVCVLGTELQRHRDRAHILFCIWRCHHEKMTASSTNSKLFV